MTSKSIMAWFRFLRQPVRLSAKRNLHDLAQNPRGLPSFVRHSPVAMRYLDLLGPLAWGGFPERDLTLGQPLSPVPYAAFCLACLVKVDQQLITMGTLHRYLAEHPPLVWLAGFPLVTSRRYPWGFDAQASLPTRRHFTRLLRTMPTQPLQYLLDSSVSLIRSELAEVGVCLGESISLDTKHIPSTSSGQASPGSRRTIPKPTSATATTRTSSPQATPTAAWAASAAITSGPRRPTHLLPLPPTPSPPTPSPSESTTGAMPLASSPPRPTAGASSSWPNSPSPSTSPTSPTSSHS
jgi:hypothetical protein